jgi:hypothetical protein
MDRTNPDLEFDHIFTKFIDYANFSHIVNGYVRMIQYEVYVKDTHTEFNPMETPSTERMQP